MSRESLKFLNKVQVFAGAPDLYLELINMSSTYQSRILEITSACLIAETFSEVEQRLGLSTPNVTLRKFIKHNKIPMPQYLGKSAGAKLKQQRQRTELSDLQNGVRLFNKGVKALLYREGLKKEKCEICGWCEHRQSDGKIPVHLHHINGNPFDWRLENLQILCPNHHALTENFGSKNTMLVNHAIQNACIYCGNSCRWLYCSQTCAKLAQRKIERPSKEQLEADISNHSWVSVGKKYNVSDNTIRKWAKTYGII